MPELPRVSADIKFDIGSAPTLSINVPDEIASGKGVTNKQYSFSADPQNIPAGADYTWYSGGAAKKHGKDLKSSPTPLRLLQTTC